MTPVYKLSASSIKGRTNYGSMLAGNTAYVPKEFFALNYLATAPYQSVWNLSGASFGTKLTDPASLANVTATSLAPGYFWSRGKTSVAFGPNASPFIAAYKWNAGASPGWGTKFSDPATLPGGTTNSPTFTNNDIVVASNTTPYVLSYKWSDDSGFGTKYSNPGTLPGAATTGRLNYAGTEWAGGFAASPYAIAYPYTNGTGFGTKYATAGNGMAWNRGGSAICIPYQTTSGADSGTHGIWKWSSGWSTKYSDPSPAPDNYYSSIQPEWNHNDTAFGWAQYSKVAGNKIQVYAWDNTNGYGTKYSQPAAGDVNDGRGFGWNDDSTAISYSSNTSPYVHLWAWSNSTGFGTKSADPATLPGGLGGGQRMTKI
jgi:hypothetical protein